MNNTPTPWTDADIEDLVNGLNHMADDHLCCRATVLDTIELIKELKLERDQLRKELAESVSWVRASMESTAIASSTIAQLTRERDEARLLINEDTRSVIVENDWLRKMVDAFAEDADWGNEWLMADYRELPHVRARKTK